MAATSATSGEADRGLATPEADIRRKMSEIADWLKAQAEPPPPPRPVVPPPPPPRLHIVPPLAANEPVAAAEPAAADPAPPPPVLPMQTRMPEPAAEALTASSPELTQPPAAPLPENTAEDMSLDAILQRRLAARLERERMAAEDAARAEREASAEAEPEALRSAVAEIVERQRLLEETPVPAPAAEETLEQEPVLAEELPAPDQVLEEPPHTAEDVFERMAAQFEERAGRSLATLEASLADVLRLLQESQTPIAAAEAAAADIVDTRLQSAQAEMRARIDEVAQDLTALRREAGEEQLRTRELLDAVRDTLQSVASRLPERPAGAGAVFEELSPTDRARAAALRAMQESAERGELAAERMTQAAPERKRFIAAARRSAQPAAEARPAQKYRPSEARGADPEALAARLAAAESKTGSRRMLAAGVAAAALVFGIYAGSSLLLDSQMSGPETAELAGQSEFRTDTAAVRHAPSAPAATETPSQTAAPAASMGYSPPPVETASAAAAPEAEPMVTGSIPDVETAPLPAAIGGAKLRERAAAGDAAAQYEVAMRFAEGRGVAVDTAQAAAWLKKAADQGLAPAQYRLGSLTEKGTGVAKDLQTARRLYEEAAAAGNVQAMHNLGVLYAEGGLGQADLAIALVWFRKAAEFGVKDSQYNLGIFNARGLSVPQDLSQSYLWFALAAAQGDADAAAKRDQIGAKLGAEKTKALKVQIDTWRPKTAIAAANEVAAPAGGWDDAAGQAKAKAN